MKEIKIKIYGWSDLKKWFWDRFCFPRRKLVAKWLDYYCSEERILVENVLVKYNKEDLEKTTMLFCPRPSKIGTGKSRRFIIEPRNL